MTDPVFFAPSRRYTASEVANLTGANLVDASQADIAIEAVGKSIERFLLAAYRAEEPISDVRRTTPSLIRTEDFASPRPFQAPALTIFMYRIEVNRAATPITYDAHRRLGSAALQRSVDRGQALRQRSRAKYWRSAGRGTRSDGC